MAARGHRTVCSLTHAVTCILFPLGRLNGLSIPVNTSNAGMIDEMEEISKGDVWPNLGNVPTHSREGLMKITESL
jgi:hypothetical protein